MNKYMIKTPEGTLFPYIMEDTEGLCIQTYFEETALIQDKNFPFIWWEKKISKGYSCVQVSITEIKK